jgi:hypothetical protein
MREGRRVLEVVRDEDRGKSELVEELAQLRPARLLGVGVERRERLVEQQQGWLARERASRARRAGARLPTAASPMRARELGDPEPLEQRPDVVLFRAPKRTLCQTSRCGKSAYSWNR